jgi:hypothetical protein
LHSNEKFLSFQRLVYGELCFIVWHFFNSFTERVAKKKAKHKSKDSTEKGGGIWGQKQMRKKDREEKIGMIWRQFIEEKVEEPFSFLNHWGNIVYLFIYFCYRHF